MARQKVEPFHEFLLWLSGAPGPLGRSAARKLKRRRIKQSLRDFDLTLADVGPGSVCLDFGANLGVYTEKLAQTGAVVHAFEPDPHCFAILQEKFSEHPRVFLYNVAVARRSGTAILRRSKDFESAPDLHSQASSIYNYAPDQFQSQGIEVQVRAFSEILQEIGGDFAIIKMDIEGAEYEIIEQIMASPDSFSMQSIFIETHDRSFPQYADMIRKVRKLNWQGKLPFQIDTFWP